MSDAVFSRAFCMGGGRAMYDELVKALRNNADHYAFTGDNGLVHLLTNAADAIEELNKPKWIPVTERLPKMIDGENISKEVYVTDGAEIAKTFIMRDYDGSTDWSYTGIGKITHWCEQIPLPQPPKEES